MKKIQQTGLALLLLAMFSAVTFASIVYPELKFIGFSADGKFLAFEESGEQRGAYKDSYYDYAITYYVAVAKNSFALAPTYLEMPEGKMSNPYLVRRESFYKKQVLLKLRKLGIHSGNTGQLVVAHFLNDWSFVKPGEHESIFYEKGKTDPITKMMPDYAGGYGKQNTTDIEKVIFNNILESYQSTDTFFELTLIPTLAKPVEGCSESYKFDLTLKDNRFRRDSELQILQKDGVILSKDYFCPLGYKIERVYIYGDKILVFLNVFSKLLPGPETDMNYMSVTGKIK